MLSPIRLCVSVYVYVRVSPTKPMLMNTTDNTVCKSHAVRKTVSIADVEETPRNSRKRQHEIVQWCEAHQWIRGYDAGSIGRPARRESPFWGHLGKSGAWWKEGTIVKSYKSGREALLVETANRQSSRALKGTFWNALSSTIQPYQMQPIALRPCWHQSYKPADYLSSGTPFQSSSIQFEQWRFVAC